MISPYFSMGSIERVSPSVFFDFTTGTLDSNITIVRSGNTATRTNSSGVLVAVDANLPRFDYDPVTLSCKGIMCESTKTNILLNSLLAGTNLSSQTVTTTATTYTLSFYGTGTIALSGSYTGSLVGSGSYPTRSSLSFTATAGDLVCTVSGDVKYAQLEAFTFASSFIPTDATSKTRNGDFYSVSGSTFTNLFNLNAGTIVVEAITTPVAAAGTRILAAMFQTTSLANAIYVDYISGLVRAINRIANVASVVNKAVNANTRVRAGVAYSASAYAQGSVQGTSAQLASGVGTGIVTLGFGALSANQNSLDGCVQKFQYYPFQLTVSELNARTTG